MEPLQSRRGKGQASFEFIVILSITLLIAMIFIMTITSEYTDTFVLSGVKSTAENEIAKVAMSKPECSDTALTRMVFSSELKTIGLAISGCEVDLSRIASKVETELCNAEAPSGGTSLVCSGVTYNIYRSLA